MVYRWTEAARQPPPQPEPYVPVRWTRVNSVRRCPICNRPDWCSVTADGSVACCMRVADGAVVHKDLGHGIGHIHRLSGGIEPPPRHSAAPSRTSDRPELDYEAILARWRQYTPADALDDLAAELGVARSHLERLDVTYCPERRAWAFPMHDDLRRVVGIRLRGWDGSKFALPGSRAGVFIPRGLDSRSPLMICEGPTDTAAALMLGYQAVGRPSCSGGVHIICDWLAATRRRDAIVMADADGPGRVGAKQLADRIIGICRSVRIITALPHKDLRAWLRTGATRALVELRIGNANYHTIGCVKDELDKSRKTDRT